MDMTRTGMYITVRLLTRLNVGHLMAQGLILGSMGKGFLLSAEHQISSRAHSTAYSVGTRVSSPRGKVIRV
jgi:hypothetical protein